MEKYTGFVLLIYKMTFCYKLFPLPQNFRNWMCVIMYQLSILSVGWYWSYDHLNFSIIFEQKFEVLSLFQVQHFRNLALCKHINYINVLLIINVQWGGSVEEKCVLTGRSKDLNGSWLRVQNMCKHIEKVIYYFILII